MRNVLSVLILAALWTPSLLRAQPAHEVAVGSTIRRELDRAFAQAGSITIAVRIQSALGRVTATRDEPGRSGDLVLRDAEYYLHGLYGASAKDWQHIGPTLGAPVYDAIKWVALRCQDAGRPELEAWLRTNPSNPVSQPGGAIWAFRGLKDGWSLQGNREVIARTGGHGLSLPALDAVAPCLPIRSNVEGIWQGTIQFSLQGHSFSQPAEISVTRTASGYLGELRVTNSSSVAREALTAIIISEADVLSAHTAGGASISARASADGRALEGTLTDKNGVVAQLRLSRI